MGIFKYGSDPNRVLFVASLALVYTLADRALGILSWFQLVSAILASAMRAYRAIRPKLLFKEVAGRIFVGKSLSKRRKIEAVFVHHLTLPFYLDCRVCDLVCQV
jgi:hypothetical protein